MKKTQNDKNNKDRNLKIKNFFYNFEPLSQDATTRAIKEHIKYREMTWYMHKIF